MKVENCGNAVYHHRNRVDPESPEIVLSGSFREVSEPENITLFEEVLGAQNLNNAFLHVKRNKGAPGIDRMTVDEMGTWIRKHKGELLGALYAGTFKPNPVRRAEIPKDDGGKRELGIPTVVDRIIQQAIAQILTPIYDPMFAGQSYGYRPGRNIQQAITEVKKYAECGYTWAAQIDLSKYFDTINHELLLNIVRRTVKDPRVIDLIKKYLKSGVMVNGVVHETEEGSPQGGPLSPLLSNIYLNEFDQEMRRRGLVFIRYADDIVLLAKSPRAAQRQMESASRFLTNKLKLTVNLEKSKVTSVFTDEFKFLGFTLGQGKEIIRILVHPKTYKKMYKKLCKITKRNRGRSLDVINKEVEQAAKGWIDCFHIAAIKTQLEEWDKWLRSRIRVYIWKQWKVPKRREIELRKLGAGANAHRWSYTKSYWDTAHSKVLCVTLTNRELKNRGCFSMLEYYQARYTNG